MKRKDTFVKILPIIIIGLITVFSIMVLMAFGKMVFKNFGSKQPQVNTLQQALLNTDAQRAVQMTVRGPIVAQENFRSYQITISPNNRTIATFKGYLSEQTAKKDLGNNLPAYREFVNALDKANLAKGQPFNEDKLDGICATGTLTEFDFLENGNSIAKLWTSTCKGSVGSLVASVQQNKNLFLAQIPEYEKILASAGIK